MKNFLIILFMLLIATSCTHQNKADIVVIAHRGASGYLPEHTLASKALAYGMGADFIEQDILITKDDKAVVLHDLYLEKITNVYKMFPNRARRDGHFYVIDFSLNELRTLDVTERINYQTKRAIYPGRFPINSSKFQITTLEEEIELIHGLNKSTGKNVGIYTEIKSPYWHRQHGKDISKIILKILNKKGYKTKLDNIYLECFDPDELKRLRFYLNSDLKLIQLIDDNLGLESNANYEYIQTPNGLKEVSKYADGIGAWLPQVMKRHKANSPFVFSNLINNAHKFGLKVHVYTLRKDDLPSNVQSFDELLNEILNYSNADGIFTDFPDYVVMAKKSLN